MKVANYIVTNIAATALAALPQISYAVHPAVVAAITAAANDLANLESGSDFKSVILQIGGAHCGPPRGERSPRSTQLAQKYRAVIGATQSGDPDAIYNASAAFLDTYNRSSMFQGCWNAMSGAAQAVGIIQKIVALGQQSGPSR